MGPFQILKRVGQQVYKLELLPAMARLYLVFYVSLLEPYKLRPRFQPLVVEKLKEGS